MKTLANLLGEHRCIVNILLGPVTVHYIEVLLYTNVTKQDTGCPARLWEKVGKHQDFEYYKTKIKEGKREEKVGQKSEYNDTFCGIS